MSTDMTAMRPVTLLIRVRGEEIARVEVPGEPTANEHLVITPSVGADGRWSSSFSLLHVLTGLAVRIGRDVEELRDLADRTAGLDWSFTDPESMPEGLTAAVKKAIRASWLTDPSGVELPAHDAWGPDGKGRGLPRLALPMLRAFLADYQRAYNLTGSGVVAVPMQVPDPAKPDDPQGKPNPEWTHAIIRQVHAYGLAYLLAALQRIDPEVADSAAASLADAWEAGDSMGEWAWQWGQELAAGRSLTLPGIPGHPGEVFADTTQES